MPSRTARIGLRIASIALLALVACGDDDGTPTVPAARLAATASTLLPERGRRGCDGVNITSLTEPDRLEAMIVVQTVVALWNAEIAHSGLLQAPPAQAIDNALDIVRCDQGPRAVSRHSRAIAKLLANDWLLARAEPYLVRLGFADLQAIKDFQARVALTSAETFAVLPPKPGPAELAVLNQLATTEAPPGRMAALRPGLFGPAVAHAQTVPQCWKEEEPWDFDYGPPVTVKGHVSVALAKDRVQENVDPQQWNVCGRFWSPPDPMSPSGPPLDGAWFVKPEWQADGDCIAKPPFKPPDSVTPPGTIYDARYLLEYFFVSGAQYSPLGDAWFRNILVVQSFATTETLVTRSTVPAHRIDYSLALCATDAKVHGALGGSIYGKSLKTILDQGDLTIWSDGARTHVRVKKTFQFNDDVATWLTQLNPELHELNEQLGELACCLE